MSNLEPASSAAPAHNEAPQATPQLENPEAFSVDTILWRGFGMYARNFVPLTGLMLLLLAPWMLTNAMSSVRPNPAEMTGMTWLSFCLSMIAVPLANAAAVCGVAELVRGRPMHLVASIRAMAPSALGIVGAAIVTSIAAAIGSALCLVPGLIVMGMLYVTMPALLVERLSIGDACKRSAELTKGHRFGALFLAVFPVAINVAAALVLTGIVSPVVTAGITALTGVLLGALGAVFTSLAYIDLRNEKEPGFKEKALDDALAALTARSVAR
jgi:hypothetical protein